MVIDLGRTRSETGDVEWVLIAPTEMGLGQRRAANSTRGGSAESNALRRWSRNYGGQTVLPLTTHGEAMPLLLVAFWQRKRRRR